MTIWSESCPKSRTFSSSLDPDSNKSTSDLPGIPNTKQCRIDYRITPLNRSTSSRDPCAWQGQDWAGSALPFPLPPSPHFYFKHFSALGFPGRSATFLEGHQEQDVQKNCIFIILLLHTKSKNNFYVRKLTMPRKCCSNTSFTISPISPFLSEPVCRLLWAAGAAWCSALQNETPWSATSQVPSEKPTKQFRSRQIREGNQGERK